MKKILHSLIFIVLCYTAGAQSWCPPGATWYYRQIYQDGFTKVDGTLMLNFTGTTTVNNTVCKQLDGTFYGIHYFGPSPATATPTTLDYGSFYTYEANHVAYLYNETLQIFDTIANFNATIGDKWGYAGYTGTNCASGSRMIVTVADTSHTAINGHTLKKLTLSIPAYGGTTYSITMLETLGGTDGFLTEIQACLFDMPGYGVFNCYEDNNFTLYSKPGVSKCVYDVGIKENSLIRQLQISPNPNNGQFEIPLSEPSTVEIYNTTGALVSQHKTGNTNFTIDIRSMTAGIYYLRTKNNTSQTYSKFIKE